MGVRWNGKYRSGPFDALDNASKVKRTRVKLNRTSFFFLFFNKMVIFLYWVLLCLNNGGTGCRTIISMVVEEEGRH